MGEEEFDLICTTGGTGLSPRDHTPDATLAILDKEIPGMSEAMRYKSFSKTPHALLSRAVCGIRGKTLIINLPGSPKAIEENFDVIAPALPHALELIQGNVNDCNEENEWYRQKRDVYFYLNMFILIYRLNMLIYINCVNDRHVVLCSLISCKFVRPRKSKIWRQN